MEELISIKKEIPLRSHTGEKWKTNTSNKKRLAVDFKNKCAYCDDWDKLIGGYNSYHVEHFAPREKFAFLEFTYDNLLYSCPYCNGSKSNKWVGENHEMNVVGETGFIDPCNEEYYRHLKREKNGRIKYITKLGEYMYFELRLYLKRHEILYNLHELRSKRILIKEKIEQNRQNEKDFSVLEKIEKELSSTFCDYFEMLIEEIE